MRGRGSLTSSEAQSRRAGRGAPAACRSQGHCCVEDTIALGQTRIDRFDMRLERTPAREAIVVRNGELRLEQPCIRLSGAQRSEPLLGGSPEPVEIGIRGQRSRPLPPLSTGLTWAVTQQCISSVEPSL